MFPENTSTVKGSLERPTIYFIARIFSFLYLDMGYPVPIVLNISVSTCLGSNVYILFWWQNGNIWLQTDLLRYFNFLQG